MRFTRNDKVLTDEIREILNQQMVVNQDDSSADRRKKRIDGVKKIFNILCTTKGKTFVHKHGKFKDVVVDKLVEFHEDIPELVNKWYREIFDAEFQIPAAAAEPEEEDIPATAEPEEEDIPVAAEPEEEGCYCDDCFNTWIDRVTENAVLTRERLEFLGNVWNIMTDIYDAPNDFDYQNYNRELRDILHTDKGHLMLSTFPEFRLDMEETAYSYYSIDGFQKWEVWWHEIFGCEINDERYWNPRP
jgi:hypothetical protein